MKFTLALGLSLGIFITACGGDKSTEQASATTTAGATGLTPAQLEKGIGPITSVELGPIDQALADQGKAVFELKCSACHKIEARHVGPALRGVTQRRKPEFIMNMILNPDEMVQKHPEIQKLLAEYFVPMTFQNVTESEARSILEYFRSVDRELSK
jgi:mono/diheme cytochrome c family protein